MKKFLLVCVLLCLGASFRSPACTTAIVSAGASADGRPMIWKQRDTPKEGNYMKHYKGPVHAFTALTASGNQVWCGANDAGFMIANNLSYNLRPDSLSKLPMRAGAIMKEALGACSTVEDFEHYIATMAQPRCVTANFAVVDNEGGAAYFEVWDYGWKRYDVPENGILFRTNYSYSGFEAKGKGYGRHDLMEHLTALHGPVGYSAEWFLHVGRIIPIARPTTTASIVLEGGDSPIIWAAAGYTPGCYAIPVWVAAGEDIPACLGESKAVSSVASKLRKGSDARTLEDFVIPTMQKAEAREFKEGRALERRFARKGFDIESVREFNAGADKRFEKLSKKILK